MRNGHLLRAPLLTMNRRHFEGFPGLVVLS